jgi:predicted  nucleic acid-binding Zn-ribbon protein
LSRAKGRCMDLDANIASQKQMADDRINELEGIALDFKNKGKTLEDKIVHGTEKYLSLEKEVQTYRSLLEMEETR